MEALTQKTGSQYNPLPAIKAAGKTTAPHKTRRRQNSAPAGIGNTRPVSAPPSFPLTAANIPSYQDNSARIAAAISEELPLDLELSAILKLRLLLGSRKLPADKVLDEVIRMLKQVDHLRSSQAPVTV